MRKYDKLNNIKKANVLCENLYLQNKGYLNLSEDHIRYVLGIELPLNESYYENPLLIERIIQEQMLYEDLIKSLKDFAKEKINTVVDKINDWKDAAAFIYKLITNPQLLQNFTDNFWKTFKSGGLMNEIKTFLTRLKLDGVFQSIINVIDEITKMTGFKKFFAATAFAAIAKYMVDKLKSLPTDKIMDFLSKYLSVEFIRNIMRKITDFKSYLGVLQPIIKTTEYFFKILEPTINKFKQALSFFKQSQQTATTAQPAT